MDLKAVGKALDGLIFTLTAAGVEKDAVVKVIEVVRRNLGLPVEALSQLKLKADFSAHVKESLDGPSVDRSGADSRPREARQTSPGPKSN